MVKMRCTKCNFSFEVRDTRNAITCPNCGENDKVAKEKSAEELLNEL